MPEKETGMLLTFGKNLTKAVSFSSPWEQILEPAYIYCCREDSTCRKKKGGLKAKCNKPISTRGDEVKVTSLTRLGARVGQSNKSSPHQER